MSSPGKVFVDANVLVSTWTTDILLTLAERGFFEPRWSDRIMEEACEALCGMNRDRGWVTKYLGEIDAAFECAAVVIEAGDLDGIVLPDPNDRHVVAGAVLGGCGVVITYNLKDFPESSLEGVGVRAIHPDDFIMRVVEEDPEGVLSAVRSLVAAKKHPPRTMTEEIAGLRAARLLKFADFLDRRTNPRE
ncbi:PIN domain-containing protein [Adlercreutzia sp. ZJ242]|uniref:PIN domain-containing protein n=1 Tax=Adlercreutzia sp. ZJ242 TaxID=2709409 RepID=UPI0013EAEE3B|nr:PIN domain-containing protein [Adlercreutzia sp. ZJ242]